MNEQDSDFLSHQAIGSIMMALQKCIMEQEDITEILRSMEFVQTDDGLMVQNPPVFQVDNDEEE
tara:strand:+ start:27 stop:218 length:192 start_codon:yes stop_codon:yes gene_type:complete